MLFAVASPGEWAVWYYPIAILVYSALQSPGVDEGSTVMDYPL